MSHWKYQDVQSSSASMDVITNNGEWTADVRFDGCVNLRRLYPGGDHDYLHICDLEEFISQLQELLEMEKAHFRT